MSEAEFSRLVRIDTIGDQPRAMTIAAEPAERGALARRFGLVAIDRLEAEVSLHRNGQDVVANGRIVADVVQSCVITDVPVPAKVDAPFVLTFRTDAPAAPKDDEIELGDEEMDVVFYDGGAIDVGEAVAQTLALSLDPYPRAPEAAAALREAGVKDEGEAGPFGALAGLRDKLGK